MQIVEQNNALRRENEYLRKQLQSTKVLAGSSLEKENKMLRSQMDKMKIAMESYLNSDQMKML